MTTAGHAELVAVSALVAEPTRCRILLTLGDGRALPASVLASEAGVAPSTASAHLSKLLDADLLAVEQHGRHRYYRLAGEDVAALLEVLGRLAPRAAVRSLRDDTRERALRDARLCYDHLAGRLGVTLHRTLLDEGVIAGHDGTRRPGVDRLSARGSCNPYRVGAGRSSMLDALDVDLDLVGASTRRPLLSFCMDWSEQCHHLSGALGAAIATAMFDQGWLEHTNVRRAVRLTERGAKELGRLR
jgi:DNA-binding transcriptional ArsR family regulator